MSCPSLLACRVSAERSAVNLMGIPLYVICCFSLVAFNIFSLYLILDSLINMCLGVFLLGFILYGTLCASWTCQLLILEPGFCDSGEPWETTAFLQTRGRQRPLWWRWGISLRKAP